MRTSNITCQGQRDTETGEPDDAISIKSGSERGWEKRPAMDLARSLPNLIYYELLGDEPLSISILTAIVPALLPACHGLRTPGRRQ